MGSERYNKFFRPEEFACPLTGHVQMSELFIDTLTAARIIAGIPFIITSGFRSEEQNRKLLADPAYKKFADPDSAHLKGVAADISIDSGRARWRIVNALIRAGFTRIGIGSDHIHVDAAGWKPQQVIWRY